MDLGTHCCLLLGIHSTDRCIVLVLLKAPRVEAPFFLNQPRNEMAPGDGAASRVLLVMEELFSVMVGTGFSPLLEHNGYLVHRKVLDESLLVVEIVSCGGCDLEDMKASRHNQRRILAQVVEAVVDERMSLGFRKSAEVAELAAVVVDDQLPSLLGSGVLRISMAVMAGTVSGVVDDIRFGRLMVCEILCCGKLEERSSLILSSHRLVGSSDVRRMVVVEAAG